MTQAANGGAQAPSILDPRAPKPGVYDGVPASVYHDLDLISASGLKTLDGDCAAQYRFDADHPEDDASKASDIGTAAHLIFLEPHLFEAKVECLNVDGFQTKGAREARDIARACGRTALKTKDFDTVLAMREALFRQVGNLFVGGVAERTYIWRDLRTGVLCKARVDYVRPNSATKPDGLSALLIDYKTSGSANPRAFRARCWDNGHHIQAWWYLYAHEFLTGESASWRWVVQSTKPPFLVTAHKPTPGLIGWAEQQGRAALQQYARCLREGSWPGYGDVVHPVELPSWAMYQLSERAEQGDFRLETAPKRSKKALKPAEVERGIAAFSPLSGGLTS
jgi:hypothetical protein